ncbi:MAG: HDOD domain-containing protein [bacterium]
MPQAVSDVIQHLSDLPPFPKVTTKLLLVLEDPAVSIDQLAALISSDPSLVVKVIHLSNSPFYMVSRPIASVTEAVFVLGINTIKSITTAVSIQKGISTLKPHPGSFSMDAFWRHSYATAIVASKLGARRNKQLSDKLYLAGLVHDVGKIIQACFWPETWKSAINYLLMEGGTLESVEQRLFGECHAEIAATLCRNWRFPTDVVSLLGRPDDDVDEDQEVTAGRELLELANSLASASGFAFPPEEQRDGQDSAFAPYADLMANLADEVHYQLDILER